MAACRLRLGLERNDVLGWVHERGFCLVGFSWHFEVVCGLDDGQLAFSALFNEVWKKCVFRADFFFKKAKKKQKKNKKTKKTKKKQKKMKKNEKV